ncbi:MAG: metallophosphoesterase [Solirubrobacteraceae bacterium]|nr:metallophosphoesterase [Solirubrobacteraceae bacterium]
MTAPTVVLQLSDPHLVDGDDARTESFRRAIAKAVALDLDPAAVLVTGDLAHGAAPAEYALAAELLGAFAAPVHVIPGNKDDRAALREMFAVGGIDAEPVRYVAEAGPLRLVMTDSTIPGEVPGRLDVGWIAEQLGAAPVHPTLLAFHHPPYVIGVPGLDAVGLPAADRTALAELLERSPQVLRVVSGHVHRPTSATFGGRPASTAPSVAFAFALDLAGGAPTPTDDPPGFVVHVYAEGQLVSHVVPV